eukprot:5429768-Alexandrium_andersonii.AAC.1
MSASLVGSEMCIRDSFSTRDPPERVGTVVEGIAGDGLGAEFATTVGEPVSYTHLTLPTICSV